MTKQLKQRRCRNDNCDNKFSILNGNGSRYCSPECRKAQQKKMSTKSRNARKRESDRVKAAVAKARRIFAIERGSSWVEELGLGEQE